MATSPKTNYQDVDKTLLKALDNALTQADNSINSDLFSFLLKELSSEVFNWLEDYYIDNEMYDSYQNASASSKFFDYLAIPNRGGIWNSKNDLAYVIARMIHEQGIEGLLEYTYRLIGQPEPILIHYHGKH